jgi:hypothetical protein
MMKSAAEYALALELQRMLISSRRLTRALRHGGDRLLSDMELGFLEEDSRRAQRLLDNYVATGEPGDYWPEPGEPDEAAEADAEADAGTDG